jgi:hypothetical protein
MGYVMFLLHLTTQVQSESRRIFGVCENVSVREANPAMFNSSTPGPSP